MQQGNGMQWGWRIATMDESIQFCSLHFISWSASVPSFKLKRWYECDHHKGICDNNEMRMTDWDNGRIDPLLLHRFTSWSASDIIRPFNINKFRTTEKQTTSRMPAEFPTNSANEGTRPHKKLVIQHANMGVLRCLIIFYPVKQDCFSHRQRAFGSASEGRHRQLME